jgi:hypothetical protein
VLILGWTGMRGGDSMAAALAIPLTITGDVPFPGRDLIIALTFCVILATLVVQGLTLPRIIRWFGLPSDEAHEREVDTAEMAAARAALARLDELGAAARVEPELIAALRSHYEHLAEHDPDEDAADARQHERERRLRRALIAAAREAVIDLRDDGRIGDDALREAQRPLDLEELRLDEEGDDEVALADRSDSPRETPR